MRCTAAVIAGRPPIFFAALFDPGEQPTPNGKSGLCRLPDKAR